MKPIILNATPLIYLTKIGLGKLLEDLKAKKLTSPEVKREVVDEGKRKGVPDAIILEKMFQKHIFKIVEPKNQQFLSTLLQTKGLHKTDAQILVIAKEHNGIAIIDDEVARKTAKVYGIPYAGTPYILMRAVVQKLITKQQAKKAIEQMVTEGWRCSIETYTKLTKAIDRLKT